VNADGKRAQGDRGEQRQVRVDGGRRVDAGRRAPATRWRRRLLLGAALGAALLAAAVTALFLWGRLFPYSPIVTGFEKRELPHLVLYSERGAPARDYDWADKLTAGVEAWHGLTFKSRPRVLFFADESTYARQTTTRARLCTYYNGTIVVSPWVQREDDEGEVSLDVYLRHELSHALLYQHMGILAALRYPKWLLEGIATASAGQMGACGYPSREETFALIRQGDWMPPAVYGGPGEDAVPLTSDERPQYIYCEFACIVEDLIERYGRETFLAYVGALMDDHDHDAVFRAAFGVDFGAYLDEFVTRVKSGGSGPNE
jgi:hypothetical protein